MLAGKCLGFIVYFGKEVLTPGETTPEERQTTKSDGLSYGRGN